MKIGMVSGFPPADDGIATYANSLTAEMDNVVRIGNAGKVDYLVDFKSRSLRKKLRKIIDKEQLDILHIQYIAAYYSKWLFNRNLLDSLHQRIPVVSTLHEVHYDPTTIRDRILWYLEQKVVEKSAAVIVHTKKQVQTLGRENVYHILHGMEMHAMHKKKGKKLLAFGMIGEGKGTLRAVRAMQHLPDFELTVAGKIVDAKYGGQVKREAARHANVTTQLGWVNDADMDKLFRTRDIGVFPYTWAPYQSGAIHRAFAYGLPVVVSRVGAAYELVEEYGMGAITNNVTEGVRDVYKKYSTYQKGILRYRSKANWKQIAKEHVSLYKTLM